jgi:hypothetical protein
MDSYQRSVEGPLKKMTGVLVGDDLLPALKACIVADGVMAGLFGAKGERIFTEKLPSYNDTIIPLVEFYWGAERYGNTRTKLTGTVKGRIVLPVNLKGDTNKMRRIGATFERWLGTNHALFTKVAGLTYFGHDMDAQYDRLIAVSQGLVLPCIELVLPYVFDIQLFQRVHPEVDLMAPLDAPAIGLIDTYTIKVTTEDETVTVTTISKTGQKNG